MQTKSKALFTITISLLLISVFPVYTDASVDEGTGYIGYDSLNEEQQNIYKVFSLGVENKLQVIPLLTTGVSPQEFQIVMYAYMSDYPENFWASYYWDYIGTPELVMSVKSHINLGRIDIGAMSAEIKNAISSFTVSDGSMPDRVKSIHNFIIEGASYQSDTEKYPNCGNIYGAFVEHKCKCDGYSLAMDYLCKQNGIKDIVVEIGRVKSSPPDEGHAWNIIKMDNDKWYYLDLTGDKGDHGVFYNYFLVGSTTDTPSGTFKDGREIFYDYHLAVSSDKYDYDPYGLMNLVPYIVGILVAILVAILLLYLLFRRHEAKVRRQNLSVSQSTGTICSQCGAAIPPEDRFCRQCGNAIAEKVSEEVSETGAEKKE